jgi:hypothetical protein
MEEEYHQMRSQKDEQEGMEDVDEERPMGHLSEPVAGAPIQAPNTSVSHRQEGGGPSNFSCRSRVQPTSL